MREVWHFALSDALSVSLLWCWAWAQESETMSALFFCAQKFIGHTVAAHSLFPTQTHKWSQQKNWQMPGFNDVFCLRNHVSSWFQFVFPVCVSLFSTTPQCNKPQALSSYSTRQEVIGLCWRWGDEPAESDQNCQISTSCTKFWVFFIYIIYICLDGFIDRYNNTIRDFKSVDGWLINYTVVLKPCPNNGTWAFTFDTWCHLQL